MLHLREGFKGQQMIVLPPVVVELQKNDPLVSSLYITDIGYYPLAEGHFCERKQPIEENVLIYCVNGSGFYEINHKRQELRANQYVILPAHIPHSYGASEENPWTIYWIHFAGTQATYYTPKEEAQAQNIKPGITSRIYNRNNLFQEIFQTLSLGYHLENLRYASSLLHYYLATMRYLQQYRQAEGEHKNVDDSTLVAATIHYMQENIGARLSLKAIADYLGYSASYVSSVFHKATGYSPLDYFNRMKMDEGSSLLIETDMKISQISHLLGIDDAYYFSRLFSKYKGLSPKAYRKQNRL